MNAKTLWTSCLTAAAFLGLGGVALGQLEALEKRLDEGPGGIKAIALYPEPIRSAILEASLHPELVVKAAVLQAESSETFSALLADYPQEAQEAIWDLVRFSGLVEKLVEGDIKTKVQIRRILESYPEEIHKTAMEYGRKEYDLLVEIRDLNRSTEEAFEALLQGYPERAQISFRELSRHPEVMTILSEDLSLTVLLGDAYRRDLEGVKKRAAELNLEVAAEYAQSATQSGEELGENPEAPQGLEKAAKTYAERYGYDASKLEAPETGSDVKINYYNDPYPYWYGYPHWYRSPYWHGSLNWYITPRTYGSATVVYHPSRFLRRSFTPVYHHVKSWHRKRAARSMPRARAARSRRGRRH